MGVFYFVTDICLQRNYLPSQILFKETIFLNNTALKGEAGAIYSFQTNIQFELSN